MPMLRSRSVTGWPHHLIPQISCAPAVQRDLQNHSGPGRHRGNLRCAPTGGCGSTRKAPALQAVLCGSVTRHLQCCARQLLWLTGKLHFLAMSLGASGVLLSYSSEYDAEFFQPLKLLLMKIKEAAGVNSDRGSRFGWCFGQIQP